MEDKEAPNSAFTMSIKGMAMLTVCSVFSLRNLPSMAEYGWNIIFFLSAAAACFFIPSALVSAELASTYPKLPRNSSVLTFSLSGFAGICC